MKTHKSLIVLILVFSILGGNLPARAHSETKTAVAPTGTTNANDESAHVKSAAYEWLDVALEATAREHERVAPRPTVGSRMLMIITTAMYDAWAAYDDVAVGTRLGGKLSRPKKERTESNKRTAIAYATYRAMLDVYAEDKLWLDEQMRKRGFDPEDKTTDIKKPQGIGNAAAAAVIEYRHKDGANQLGDELGGNGKPYSDYTFYRPANTVDKIIDPDCWQPITFYLAGGKQSAPGYLTPHWYRVKPFALERSDMFRPPLPPKVGSEELKKEVDEVLMYNASLSPQQKAIVEFMRDGPRLTGRLDTSRRSLADQLHSRRRAADYHVKVQNDIESAKFSDYRITTTLHNFNFAHSLSAVTAGTLSLMESARHARSPNDKPYCLVNGLSRAASQARSSVKSATSPIPKTETASRALASSIPVSSSLAATSDKFTLPMADSARIGITFFSPRSPLRTAKTAEASRIFLII
jgi:hypothetical protein